jgi:glutamate/tyrosine decarboxylase-like PLP-dependent enzyme
MGCPGSPRTRRHRNDAIRNHGNDSTVHAERAHTVSGFAEADSWATDCHKWLNVPYDSGLAIVRDAEHLRAAMTVRAAYLHMGEHREPWQYTPEASQRARGIEIWAALRSLGRGGLAEMIERNCRLASRFAVGFHKAGFAVLNDVRLNQVMVSFGDADRTRRVIGEVQREGTCLCGGTEWHGQAAMRISVSSWASKEQATPKRFARESPEIKDVAVFNDALIPSPARTASKSTPACKEIK